MILYSSYNEYSYYDYCLYCSMNRCKPAEFESNEVQEWFKEQYENDIADYIYNLENSKIKNRKFILISQDDNSFILLNNINELIKKIKFHEGFDIVIYTTNDSKYIGKVYINIHNGGEFSHYLMYMFKENIKNIVIDDVKNHITDYVEDIKDEYFYG